MKRPLKEKQIENSILSFLSMRGIFAWKHESVGIFDQKRGTFRRKFGVHRKVGVSDIIAIDPQTGRIICIEVKSDTGKLTLDQKVFLSDVARNKGISFVARSIEDVAEKLGLRI
jgi:hypothetical protein